MKQASISKEIFSQFHWFYFIGSTRFFLLLHVFTKSIISQHWLFAYRFINRIVDPVDSLSNFLQLIIYRGILLIIEVTNFLAWDLNLFDFVTFNYMSEPVLTTYVFHYVIMINYYILIMKFSLSLFYLMVV